MLFHGSGVKRLAVESLIALSLAWASLQLGQIYAGNDRCAGLTALGPAVQAWDPVFLRNCDKELLNGE